MKKYNRNDVELLERIYLHFRPWMKTHPNVGMFTGKVNCPRCGDGQLQARGYAVTQTMKYRRLQCQHCGGWCRMVLAEQSGVKPPTSI